MKHNKEIITQCQSIYNTSIKFGKNYLNEDRLVFYFLNIPKLSFLSKQGKFFLNQHFYGGCAISCDHNYNIFNVYCRNKNKHLFAIKSSDYFSSQRNTSFFYYKHIGNHHHRIYETDINFNINSPYQGLYVFLQNQTIKQKYDYLISLGQKCNVDLQPWLDKNINKTISYIVMRKDTYTIYISNEINFK